MGARNSVPQSEAEAAFACGKDLKEIATHLLRWLVDGFDSKARDGLDLFRQEHLLHLLRGGQFALKLRLAATDGGGAQQHDDRQRQG